MTSQAAETQISDEQWRDLAACRNQATKDRDLWHPPKSKKTPELYDEARQFCEECPVRLACLAFALDLLQRTGNVHGLWAGMTAAELRRHARSTGRPARKVAQHGTRSRYVRGCRCPACRAANSRGEAQRRVAAQPIPDAADDRPTRRPGSRGGGSWSRA